MKRSFWIIAAVVAVLGLADIGTPTPDTESSVVVRSPLTPPRENWLANRLSTATLTPTPTGTASLTPTTTLTPTPTMTPTSYRVFDLSITLDDSADPVMPGETFRYRIETWATPIMAAPGFRIGGSLFPPEEVRFTGAYTTDPPSWGVHCYIGEPSSFFCSGEWVAPFGTLYLDAVANILASGNQVTLCARTWFVSPMGGYDPNPVNNSDCEETTIATLPYHVYLPLIRKNRPPW